MTRKTILALGPSLLAGAGIIAATVVASMAANDPGWVLLSPLLLAFAVVAADVLDSLLRGRSPRPSADTLIFAGAFVLAGAILAMRDPSLVKTLIPLFGASAWSALILQSKGRRNPCRRI